jgi:ribosomal protein RSM22 (predicted rRNA methylase)
MLSNSLRRSACAACRLHQNIAAKQLARSKWSLPLRQVQTVRGFGASPAAQYRSRRGGTAQKEKKASEAQQKQKQDQEQERGSASLLHDEIEATGMSEEQARLSRLLFVASMKVGMETERLIELVEALQKDLSKEDRALKVREGFGDVLPEGLLGEEEEKVYLRLYGEPVLRMREVDLEVLEAEVVGEMRAEAEAEENEDGTGVLREGVEGELEEIEFEDEEGFIEEGEDGEILDPEDADARLVDDMRIAMEREEDIEEDDEDVDPTLRAHPLTSEGRFTTLPSSIQLPKSSFTQPIEVLLSGTPNVHIKDAAHRIFGGIGLPNSTSTPSIAKTMQQRPIPIDATQARMTEIDANNFMAVLMPAMYSTTMSALVESRKRLGTAWAEGLVRKAEAGELKILDAGGAGAGVMAVREMLKAEWERMHEEDIDASSSMGVAEADGKLGGPNLAAPLGNATVLTGSDALRQRSSALLENTTFIPRLPDYFHTETAKQTGKFDIVIAPHTLFPIREDWARRNHVDNLWSLASAEGGLLIMLEKGVARGFEAIALAREHILKNHIADPTAETTSQDIDESDIRWEEPTKDTGMIVAPCTNHTDCPMYSGKNKGVIKGRKDICHFQQRYTRPPFLQKILGAKDKNFEDLKFSYVSLIRGRDLRIPTPERTDTTFATQPTAVQGDKATDRAFLGYDNLDPETEPNPSTLSLPRQILHPLKRRGHVILDMCTPAGSLERWTVPRSFSKRAFRDARKSSWGDLWALGAKTRVVRTARVGDKKRDRRAEKDGEEDAPERKALSKRLVKEKRRVKERKAGKKGVLLGREVDVDLD